MLLLGAMTRLIGMLWMLALALLGLGVALYCLDGLISLGSARPDRLLSLPTVRRHVARFLGQIAAPGATAGLAMVCGIGAILIGALLLAGVLRSRKERLVVLERDTSSGTLAARPGTLRAMIRALAEQAPGATAVNRPRLKLSRRGQRGRLKVNASRTRTSDRREVERAIKDHLAPVSDPFNLKPRIRVHFDEGRERVQ